MASSAAVGELQLTEETQQTSQDKHNNEIEQLSGVVYSACLLLAPETGRPSHFHPPPPHSLSTSPS